jgi:hypothetical protein
MCTYLSLWTELQALLSEFWTDCVGWTLRWTVLNSECASCAKLLSELSAGTCLQTDCSELSCHFTVNFYQSYPQIDCRHLCTYLQTDCKLNVHLELNSEQIEHLQADTFVDWTDSDWTELVQTELNWTSADCRLNWTELVQTELNWSRFCVHHVGQILQTELKWMCIGVHLELNVLGALCPSWTECTFVFSMCSVLWMYSECTFVFRMYSECTFVFWWTKGILFKGKNKKSKKCSSNCGVVVQCHET